jgi:hypothetical protein
VHQSHLILFLFAYKVVEVGTALCIIPHFCPSHIS